MTHVEVAKYEVSVLPRDHVDRQSFQITVEWRGPGDLWAVLRSHWCYGTDREWDYEPLPSDRTDAWKAAHRFPVDEALALAIEAAPDIEINGFLASAIVGVEGTET